VRGLAPDARPARERARLLAVLPESEPLPYDFPASAVVALGRYPHQGLFGRESDDDRRAIARAVEIAGVGALLSRGINELSAGERQRVLLARALAQEPELVLLDEPTAHLDPGRQVNVMATLRTLASQRTLAVVAVLHEPNLAARYADRVLLLGPERPIALGSPREVITAERLEAAYGIPFRVFPRARDPGRRPRLNRRLGTRGQSLRKRRRTAARRRRSFLRRRRAIGAGTTAMLRRLSVPGSKGASAAGASARRTSAASGRNARRATGQRGNLRGARGKKPRPRRPERLPARLRPAARARGDGRRSDGTLHFLPLRPDGERASASSGEEARR